MAASEYHGLHRRPVEHFGDARDALYMFVACLLPMA